MKLIPAFVLLFLPLLAAAQNGAQTPENSVNPEEPIYTIVEQMPQFPGGEGEFYTYIAQTVNYPEMARDMGVQGTVYVQFIIDTKGVVRDAKVVRGIGSGCDEEALRVVNKMPAWSPGTQDGKPVSVSFRLPIKFLLD